MLMVDAAMMAAGALFLIGLAGLGTGHSAGRGRLVYGGSAAVCAIGLAISGMVLLSGGDGGAVTLPIGLPWSGAHFRLDALSAFFLVIVNLGGVAASIYALGHGKHESHPHRVLPFYPVFLAAMSIVPLAADAFSFLMAWELMSLSSWGLVVSHHRERHNRGAGYLYLVMASFGTMMLLFAFGVLAGAESDFTFAAIRERALPEWGGAAVLVLTLLGAGSKAGLVPLHVWLPLAHPAAPSHVSALMSGVMTKIAIYGAIRILFDLAGEPQWWWAAVILAVAAVTVVIGVLQALMQNDLKRLLAYSTVENIGIIFLGLGLGLAFLANGLPGSAAVALTGALLHALNHSVFKGLLFLGSGAVVHATGERDIGRMGGLIHRMPSTAVLFLVGSAAISALPPLNGFVSEWLTFQAILASPDLPQAVLKFLVPIVGALLALAATLAAACFVKAFGITFLGRPRSDAAANARETDRFSLVAMGGLAALCFVIGVLSPLVADQMAPVVRQLAGASLPLQASQTIPLSLVPFDSVRSSYDGFIILAFMIVSSSLTAWFIHRFASREIRRGPAWDCGHPEDSPITQYSAASFSQPIRRVFGTVVFRTREHVDMPMPGELRPAHLTVTMIDPVWRFLFTPIPRFIARVSSRIDLLQFLTIRRYLSLSFVALIVLLVVVALWH